MLLLSESHLFFLYNLKQSHISIVVTKFRNGKWWIFNNNFWCVSLDFFPPILSAPSPPCLSGMSTFCWLQTRYQCMLWNCWWPWVSIALLLWGDTTMRSLLLWVPSVSISSFLLGISNNRPHYCITLTSILI